MKKKGLARNQKVLLYALGGIAAAVFVAEIPEMVRYVKMMRL